MSEQPAPIGKLTEKKARLLAFVSEHHLPFSTVPDLIELSKSLSDDKCKTLSKLNMTRYCATYTLTHGLAAAMKDSLKRKLKDTFFSFNVDEATNNAMD